VDLAQTTIALVLRRNSFAFAPNSNLINGISDGNAVRPDGKEVDQFYRTFAGKTKNIRAHDLDFNPFDEN